MRRHGKADRGGEGSHRRNGTGPLLDVALIIGAQKVAHYEIAGYGSLIELAKLLGYDRAVRLPGETLEEEKSADEKLAALAIGDVNEEAQSFRERA